MKRQKVATFYVQKVNMRKGKIEHLDWILCIESERHHRQIGCGGALSVNCLFTVPFNFKITTSCPDAAF